MSSQHKKPMTAFIVLAVMAAALIGTTQLRAKADSTPFVAAGPISTHDDATRTLSFAFDSVPVESGTERDRERTVAEPSRGFGTDGRTSTSDAPARSGVEHRRGTATGGRAHGHAKDRAEPTAADAQPGAGTAIGRGKAAGRGKALGQGEALGRECSPRGRAHPPAHSQTRHSHPPHGIAHQRRGD